MLDTRDLVIEKIESGSKVVAFRLDSSVEFLGQALHIPLTGETGSVTVHYHTLPKAAALQWLQPDQTAGKKAPFLFSQSQAILARTWVRIQDSPGLRYTYDAIIRVPKGMLALMSAENPVKQSSDGVYKFNMKQPVPAYLLALAVGD